MSPAHSPAPPLEDDDEEPVRRADREQVEDDRLEREHDRAERPHEQDEGRDEDRAEQPGEPAVGEVEEVLASRRPAACVDGYARGNPAPGRSRRGGGRRTRGSRLPVVALPGHLDVQVAPRGVDVLERVVEPDERHLRVRRERVQPSDRGHDARGLGAAPAPVSTTIFVGATAPAPTAAVSTSYLVPPGSLAGCPHSSQARAGAKGAAG